MKRIIIAAVFFPVVCFFAGCKKDKTVSTVSLFENTVWTGEFNYTGLVAEPYSLQCNADGSFIWYQYGGSYLGAWILDDKSLTLAFTSGVTIKAQVSDDKTLVSIQNLQANGWSLISGQYNPSAEQSLDGTTWKENSNQGTFVFSTGTKVSGTGIFAGIQDAAYSRTYGTVVIPWGISFYFSVLMPDAVSIRMINKTLPNFHPYVLRKQ